MKTRVNLIIAAILAGIVAIGGLLVIRHVRESVARETGSALRLALEMLDAGRLQEPLPSDLAERWMAILERLHQARHVRLWILQDRSPPPLTNQADFPSRVPEWFAALVHPPQTRVEREFTIHSGNTIRVVLMADPNDEIAEAWEETQVFLGLILLLAASCFIALTWILGRAFRPVDLVLEGLVALEKGNYHHRLPDFPQPEWYRIARAFNHCAAVLERTREDNRSLTRQLLEVEEEERRTLARELHDELGQSLTGIRMLARSIQRGDDVEQTSKAAHLIVEQVDRLFTLIHGMIHRLRPLMLDDLGLSAALNALVDDWRHRKPEVTIRLESDAAIDRLPPEHQIHIYRIVQEALTNAFRHAQPGTIRIRLSRENSGSPRRRWLKILIQDDGIGCSTPSARAGHGLRGMQERVESLGGRFELRTAPRQGFTLFISLPFEEAKHHAHPRHASG